MAEFTWNHSYGDKNKNLQQKLCHWAQWLPQWEAKEWPAQNVRCLLEMKSKLIDLYEIQGNLNSSQQLFADLSCRNE